MADGLAGALGRLAPGQVEARRQAAEVLVGRGRDAEGAAHGRARGFPHGAGQKAFPWIGVAQGAPREHVASADRAPEPVEHRQAIAGQVEPAVDGPELRDPSLRREGGRWRPGSPAAALRGAEILNGVEQRATGGRGVQLQAAQESRRVAQPAWALPELDEEDVVLRQGRAA